MRSIPEARLDIDDPFDEEAVTAAILAKADELVAAGVAPTFQVWYPTSTVDDFDVVTVSAAGTLIETEPSYLTESTDG
jgi:hypothetical protein